MDDGSLTPTALIEASLELIERRNPELNAVVTLSGTALDEARTLERRDAAGEPRGPLYGLPVGIKDVTEVGGLRTTYGSPMYADHVPEEDALVVRRLRSAGAVILGKTNTPEFAAGGNTFNEVFGRTRNPWNPALSAGGSTGGGAVGLATGMIALAEGTDLGGSLRIPASFCGVVGLRPSPGLVPTYPSAYLWDNLQVTGPMARTAEDVALMLGAVCGPSPLSPAVQPVAGRDFVAAVRRGPKAGLRIAYAPDPAGLGIDPDVAGVCRYAADRLARDGYEVEEVALDLSYGFEAALAIRGLWMVTHQYARLDRIDELGVNVRANTEAGLRTSVAALASAEQARGKIWEDFRRLFERFDHLLTPCMAVPPFPVEQNYPETIGGRKMSTYVDWIAPTFVLSLAGLPVASVPCGLDANGLPVGMQIVGRPRDEESVLALAGRAHDAWGVGLPDVRTMDNP
jgi:amidase